MLDLDIDQFWKDDALAHQDNCFSPSAPQIALGIRMSDECVFAELGEEGTPWAPIPLARRRELNRRYNDRAERIVGRRLLEEAFLPEDAAFPSVKRIGEVFEGRYLYHNDTEWLTQSVSSYGQLEALLDRVDRLNLRDFMLPANWAEEKRRIFEQYGLLPPLMRHIRGPVTLACSIMGSENLIFLLMDEPDLGRRFSKAIARVTLEMAAIMDQEAGVTPASQPGFSFADDNCCLLNCELYELFGYPVLKEVFDRYSPNPGDARYQHSDSNMEHLLPLLGQLQLTGVNFGPTVLIPAIRKHLPRARIDGCLAPFTFMRNDDEAILREVRRDCEQGRIARGVNLTTAGSINNGSSLKSLRTVMAGIQNYGRF